MESDRSAAPERERRPDRHRGPLHNPFWDWTAKGELRLPRCSKCAKPAWPVKRACDNCGGNEFAWEPMSGRGRIVAWCTFVQDYYRGLLPVPYNTILVELDEGPLFISDPDGFAETEMAPGRAVEVRFKPCSDSGGSFELPVFALA